MKKLIYPLFSIFISYTSCSQTTGNHVLNGPLTDKNQNSVVQWRGPNRDGSYSETGLLTKWADSGPKLIWTTKGIGSGYASVIIADNSIFTTGLFDNKEYLVALDLNGNLKWKKEFGRPWDESFPESRCTPLFDNGKVYMVSGKGDIACFDASNGNKVWGYDASGKFGTRFGEWGISESLMIVDNKLIFTPCGNKTTVVALDKNTGETIWKSEPLNDKNAYSSPILVERGGKKIIINISGNYMFGVNSDDGKMLWKHNISQYSGADNGDINCNTPLYYDGCVFITSGYDDTGLMFNLAEDGNSVSLKWKNSALDTHHGNVVLVNGYIYGSNWINNGNGNWVCVDWNTGQTMYETKWKNKGSIITDNGLLYCYEEKSGYLGLVKANPKSFDVLSSFKISNGKGPHWSHPVICDGRLYVRHSDYLMVYDLKTQ